MTEVTAPPTIVEFLNARLDEQEADGRRLDYLQTGEFLLADAAAKRAILQRWEYRWQEANDATEQHLNAMFASQATGLGNAVGLIAEIYSEHPDYDEDWKLRLI